MATQDSLLDKIPSNATFENILLRLMKAKDISEAQLVAAIEYYLRYKDYNPTIEGLDLLHVTLEYVKKVDSWLKGTALPNATELIALEEILILKNPAINDADKDRQIALFRKAHSKGESEFKAELSERIKLAGLNSSTLANALVSREKPILEKPDYQLGPDDDRIINVITGCGKPLNDDDAKSFSAGLNLARKIEEAHIKTLLSKHNTTDTGFTDRVSEEIKQELKTPLGIRLEQINKALLKAFEGATLTGHFRPQRQEIQASLLGIENSPLSYNTINACMENITPDIIANRFNIKPGSFLSEDVAVKAKAIEALLYQKYAIQQEIGRNTSVFNNPR